MKGYVYVIQSQKNQRYYIGSSTDVPARLKQHNHGQVQSTRYNRPYALVFYQEFENVKIAQQIERRLKNLKRKDYIEKIIRDEIIKMDP